MSDMLDESCLEPDCDGPTHCVGPNRGFDHCLPSRRELPMLLGLGGYAESGKDAVAEILEKWGWHRTYMSKPLEQALLTLDPYVRVELHEARAMGLPQGIVIDGVEYVRVRYMRYKELHALVGYQRSKKCADVRRLLQMLGTEVGRMMAGENVWVNHVFVEVDAARQFGRPSAVTAIRYANELATLRHEGGVAVWVRRTTPDGVGAEPVNTHSSDNSLRPEDFDMVLENDSTLEELATKVYAMLGYLNASSEARSKG